MCCDWADLLSIRELETFMNASCQKGHTVGVHLCWQLSVRLGRNFGSNQGTISSRVAFRVSSKVDALML